MKKKNIRKRLPLRERDRFTSLFRSLIRAKEDLMNKGDFYCPSVHVDLNTHEITTNEYSLLDRVNACLDDLNDVMLYLL